MKGAYSRAVIGDFVDVSTPEGHDKGIIEDIEPRSREFVRKDPTERALPQVLAANFDRVLVAQPLADVNLKRLERELVLAHETGAAVTVVLTKADLAESERQVDAVRDAVAAIAGDVGVLVVSSADPESVEAVRALICADTTAVLIGKSGVGKSSLVNLLVGEELLETGDVREGDGKGRHTTVSREIVDLPGGGRIVDMPGVRGLGLWDAEAGIGAAFPDIEDAATRCRFRDCRHEDEPGCAVRAAVEAGEMTMGELAEKIIPEDCDLTPLTHPSELALMRKMADFGNLIALAARDRAPFRLTHYAQDLASLFHQFYTNCHVLTDDADVQTARLALCDATRIVLALSLNLLGVSAPVKM